MYYCVDAYTYFFADAFQGTDVKGCWDTPVHFDLVERLDPYLTGSHRKLWDQKS